MNAYGIKILPDNRNQQFSEENINPFEHGFNISQFYRFALYAAFRRNLLFHEVVPLHFSRG